MAVCESVQIERQNRPEVEDKGSKELLLNPITITRRYLQGLVAMHW
jgi:hypothetical protein